MPPTNRNNPQADEEEPDEEGAGSEEEEEKDPFAYLGYGGADAGTDGPGFTEEELLELIESGDASPEDIQALIASGEAPDVMSRVPRKRNIFIRQGVTYEEVFRALLDEQVSVTNILSAEAAYKQGNEIPEDEELSGDELLLAVANGLPPGAKGSTSGDTVPLITEEGLDAVLVNIDSVDDGDFKGPKLKPRLDTVHTDTIPGPTKALESAFNWAFYGLMGDRDDETLSTRLPGVHSEKTEDRRQVNVEEFISQVVMDTFREDGKVLSRLTEYLEQTGNNGMINRLGLGRYATNKQFFAEATPLEGEPITVEDVAFALAPEGRDVVGAGGAFSNLVRATKRAVKGVETSPEGRKRQELLRKFDEWRHSPMRNARPGVERPLPSEMTEERRGAPLPSDIRPQVEQEGSAKLMETRDHLVDRIGRMFGETTEGEPPPPPDINEAAAQVRRSRDKDDAVISRDLANELVRSYRTGRFELASDDPRRDPDNILTPIQQQNHSSVLDRKTLTPESEKAKYAVRNPYNLYMSEDLALGKMDQAQLNLKNFVPGTPAYDRAAADLEWATSEEAAQMLYSLTVPPDARVMYYEPGTEPEIPATERPLDMPRFQMPENAFSPYSTKRPRVTPKKGPGNPEGDADEIEFMSGREATAEYEASFYNYMDKVQKMNQDLDTAYGTANDAGKMWRELTIEDRKEIQWGAYLAGEYGGQSMFSGDPMAGPMMDPFQLVDGDLNDAVAYEYWVGAVQQAALSAARGAPITPNQVVRNVVDDYKTSLESYWGASVEDIQKVINIDLSDPNAIAEDARTVAQTLMGRDPTETEIRNLVGVIHNGERSDQLSRARAQASVESTRRSQLADWQRRQFNLFENQLNSDRFGSLDLPGQSGASPSYPKSTMDLITSLKSKEPGAQQPPVTRGSRGGTGELYGAAGAAGMTRTSAETFSPTGGTGEIINENVGFDPGAAMMNMYRQQHGEEIDLKRMEDLFANLAGLLRSPISI